jgi:hypothetical protein
MWSCVEVPLPDGVWYSVSHELQQNFCNLDEPVFDEPLEFEVLDGRLLYGASNRTPCAWRSDGFVCSGGRRSTVLDDGSRLMVGTTAVGECDDDLTCLVEGHTAISCDGPGCETLEVEQDAAYPCTSTLAIVYEPQ